MSAYNSKECTEHGCICATCAFRYCDRSIIPQGCQTPSCGNCLSNSVPLDYFKDLGHDAEWGGISKCDYYQEDKQ